jgi:hypothetical protein
MKCNNEWVSLFVLTTLSFERYLHKHLCGILQFRKPKNWPKFSNSACKKGWATPHENFCFFLTMSFLVSWIDNSASHITWRKVGFLSIEWCQVCWEFSDEWPSLRVLESAAVLGFCVVFTHAYSIDILQFLYISIDMSCIFFLIEFEYELSISVKRERATRYKNLELEIEKLL